MSDSYRLKSIKRIEFSNPDQFIWLQYLPCPLRLRVVSSRPFNKGIDFLTQLWTPQWPTGPVNIALSVNKSHSLSKQPLTAIVRKAIIKIISCISSQIFWGEKNGKGLLFSFLKVYEMQQEWVTYTLISYAGCLCLVASSHLGTSAQSSSSLWEKVAHTVGHKRQQKVIFQNTF